MLQGVTNILEPQGGGVSFSSVPLQREGEIKGWGMRGGPYHHNKS